MEGFVIASNGPMLALARRLGFRVEREPDDGTVMRVVKPLQTGRTARSASSTAA